MCLEPHQKLMWVFKRCETVVRTFLCSLLKSVELKHHSVFCLEASTLWESVSKGYFRRYTLVKLRKIVKAKSPTINPPSSLKILIQHTCAWTANRLQPPECWNTSGMDHSGITLLRHHHHRVTINLFTRLLPYSLVPLDIWCTQTHCPSWIHLLTSITGGTGYASPLKSHPMLPNSRAISWWTYLHL